MGLPAIRHRHVSKKSKKAKKSNALKHKDAFPYILIKEIITYLYNNI